MEWSAILYCMIRAEVAVGPVLVIKQVVIFKLVCSAKRQQRNKAATFSLGDILPVVLYYSQTHSCFQTVALITEAKQER